jgi:hypothetical protein
LPPYPSAPDDFVMIENGGVAGETHGEIDLSFDQGDG